MAFYTANLNKKAKNHQKANSAIKSEVKNSNNLNQQNGDKNFTLISIIVFGVILSGVIVIGTLLDWGFWPTSIVAIIAMLIVFLIFNYVKNSACPKCGKKLSMREISRKITRTYATTIDVKREIKNTKGDVVRTYYEAVPATKYYYDCVDECKFCGYRRNVERSATYRD